MMKPSGWPLVTPVRLVNLVWLVVLGAVWLAAVLLGTPHLRIVYTYTASYERPYYHRCTYWGLHPFVMVPQDGKCQLIVLARGGER